MPDALREALRAIIERWDSMDVEPIDIWDQRWAEVIDAGRAALASSPVGEERLTDDVVRLTRREFDDLPEYSLSIPTGTTIGKRWKCNQRAVQGGEPSWFMGEYIDDPDPKMVGIRWLRIEIDEVVGAPPVPPQEFPASVWESWVPQERAPEHEEWRPIAFEAMAFGWTARGGVPPQDDALATQVLAYLERYGDNIGEMIHVEDCVFADIPTNRPAEYAECTCGLQEANDRLAAAARRSTPTEEVEA